MPFGRIQKLLCDEYCQFEDTVLIESPFAETTRDGRGLEQVHLGITPTKLIIAGDTLDPLCDVIWYGQDPEVETLELMSLYPVEYVNLSVCRSSRRQRQLLKAMFANNVTRYFELGGLEKRKMFWNLWCERVQHLNPEGDWTDSGTSRCSTPRRSQATVISWNTRHYQVSAQGNTQLATAHIDIIRQTKRPKWTDKDLHLGARRKMEDRIRLIPVIGMGATPELKFVYLSKPSANTLEVPEQTAYCNLRETCDYDVFTYTGGPTSNVTYSSLPKAYSAGGKSR